MYLEKISIQNIRNLENISLALSPSINFFIGSNAAGKTSLLEAIYFLATSRSFLSIYYENLVRYQTKEIIVFGSIYKNMESIPLGVSRTQDKVLIRIQSESVQKISLLASQIPIQVFYPESHIIITGSAKERRRFIDWLAFHVKPNFSQLWSEYQRILKQRNSLLKNKSNTIQYWDKPFVDLNTQIQDIRKEFLPDLVEITNQFWQYFYPDRKITLDYHPGWSLNKDLSLLLKENYDKEIRYGYTLYGSHRADVKILIDDIPAHLLSRGQQKLLVILLKCAQILLLKQYNQKQSIFLLDDLTAEIDAKNQQKLIQILQDLSIQLFITAINIQSLSFSNWQNVKQFYIEEGKIIKTIG